MLEETQKVKGKGINAYIHNVLNTLGPSDAVSVAALTAELLKQFSHIKDNTSASARINLVMKQKKVAQDYKKIVSSKDNKVYLTRKTEEEKQLEAVGVTPPVEKPVATE